MLLLGALLAQVWHWHKWTAKERTFIKVIVVCPLLLYRALAIVMS